MPGKAARSHNKDYVARICQDTAPAALDAMCEAGVSRPFRFLYMSGVVAERDQTKKPMFMAEYGLMRVSVPPTIHQI